MQDTLPDSRLNLLLKALREAAILGIAAVEDYLGTPYDRSALAKRRNEAGKYRVRVVQGGYDG